jgi:hypothetical protein
MYAINVEVPKLELDYFCRFNASSQDQKMPVWI